MKYTLLTLLTLGVSLANGHHDVVVTPEPTTWLLMGTGLIGLVLASRHWRKRD